ncbi:MAG: HDOD domain-containing protein [Phycisphaerae bacterium]
MAVVLGAKPSTEQTPRERVELILHHLDRLPTLPAVVGRLLAATTSTKSSASDVVQIIESDGVLTAAILRMTRRADLGISSNVVTVRRAVTLLGFRAVRNAVLSMRIYETLGAPDALDKRSTIHHELWKHSLAVACVADLLAERMRDTDLKEQAFVCGLLHDIGKIALDVCLPKSYARVVARVERERTCICDVERDMLGMDHSIAGKRLVTKWQLPRAIMECVWLHHQEPDALPSSTANAALVQLIHLADGIVRRQRVGFSGYGCGAGVEACAAGLGLDEPAVTEVAGQLPAHMEPFCALVGLDDATDATSYAESLARANNELGRTNEALAEANREYELRARCFDALTTFNERLGETTCIADVCAAAAQCVGECIGADSTLAFVGDAQHRCLHVGCRMGCEERPTSMVLDVGDGHSRDILAAATAVSLGRTICSAPEGCEAIWQRCEQSAPSGPVWMLPFAQSDELVGAVFFVADPMAVARWREASVECRALSCAIEHAVASARTSTEAERMNEELFDLNRRLRAAQQRSVRARSISMIAEMAAGAAHELNNPLSVISGRAQMAACEDNLKEIERTLRIIREKAHEASQIVLELMQFAKPDPPEPRSQRLGSVLQRRCQHWRRRFSLTPQQITSLIADDGTTVHADPEQLHEILDAVVNNAVEAAARETLHVQVNSPSRVTDETVRIVIEDNGVGMSPDILERAFDPFFSSRPAGRGRGLGLSRAYRLAEINGGCVWIESTLNLGTTVTIELPARPSQQASI